MSFSRLMNRVVLGIVFFPTMTSMSLAQPGTVLSHQKISDTAGNFTGVLDDGDNFGGLQITALGDLNGDGFMDLAVGAWHDDDGCTIPADCDRGAVWILFLNDDGSVISHQKISDTEGGFTGVLDDHDEFGTSVTALGDLDGPGPSVLALAVGAPEDDDGCTIPDCDRGAVWILFLDVDTTGVDPVVTVLSHQKISDTAGNFTGVLDDRDDFGDSLAALGDLNGDGFMDLAVGVPNDDDGGINCGFPPKCGRGAVWILFLNDDGSVISHQKISEMKGGFTGVLDDEDSFGLGLTALGDLDGPGPSVLALAVGAHQDDDGGTPPNADRGAVWVLFLNANGTVKSHQKISDTEGGFTGILDDGDGFGFGLASLGDLDGDRVTDFAVGAGRDDDGCTIPADCDRGAVWILFLNANGTVKSHQKISDTEGGFTGILDDGDGFGASVASLGDLDGDRVTDLAVAAPLDDDGGTPPNADRGAVWVLFLDGVPPCPWDCQAAPQSGAVDVPDLLALLAAWGGPQTPGTTCDLDGSGAIAVPDLLELLANWGPCP